MIKKRSLFIFVLAIQSMTLDVKTTQAWEFGLSGETTWAYEYYNQQGRSGFFGPYDVDRGTNSYLYNRNFWYGVPRVVDQNVASGSDAAMSYLYVSFFPRIAVNNAIKLRAEYHVGGWNDSLGEMFSTKDKTPYLTDTAFGTEFAMATGHWTMYWADIQTPWGKVVFGKRPKGFGMGLQYDGARSATSESVSLTTNYGPFTIGMGFYPYRLAPPARTLANQQIQSTFNPQSSYSSSNNSYSYYQWINSQLNKADKSATNKNDFEGYVKYSAGPIDMGIFSGYFDYHIGSEWLQDFYVYNYRYYNPPTDISETSIYRTVLENASQVFHGSIYGKYNNGKFFFNCEAAWLYTSDRILRGTMYNGPHPFQSPSLAQVSYVEQWRYAIEAGTFVGPAKLSVLYAFSPGLDRRAGVMFDRQPSAILRQPTLVRQFAGVSLWRQYGYILPYTYNSGLPNIASMDFYYNYERLDSPNKEGQMLDAIVLAGRLDWALASNLNLFGTYLWAERASKGYTWGSLSPNTGSFYGSYNNQQFWTPFKVGGVVMYPAGQVAQYQPETSPNVLDTPLGYELDFGLDWKLLENMELSCLVGRWQPGSWFSYACIDRSVSGWNQYPLTSSNSFGTRPTKTIDPIWATRVSVAINF